APDLLQWCLDEGLALRFIEQMPLDAGHSWNRGSMITAADVFALLEPRFVLTPDSARATAPRRRSSSSRIAATPTPSSATSAPSPRCPGPSAPTSPAPG